MELTAADIREILRVFVESELRDLDIEVGDVKLHVSKDGGAPAAPPARSASPPPTGGRPRASAPPPAPAPPAGPVPDPAEPPPAATASAAVDREGTIAVVSPAVGVFYRRPAPDQPPYVEVGDTVEPDTPVCTIEVMKMFTEIVAGCGGSIVEVCVDNEQLVEHGQALMYVRPAAGGP